MSKLSWLLMSFTALTVSAFAAEKIELKGKWQVQPATTVGRKPDSRQWGNWGLRDWRWSPKFKGVSWADMNRKEVNSLWLKTGFKVPSGWQGSKIVLDFMRLEGDAIVFVNGEKIGERLRPYGTIDITGKVKAGSENQLMLFITRDYTDISRGAKDDPLRYYSRKKLKAKDVGLGVTAPVFLERIRRPAGITSVLAKTSWRNKQLILTTEIDAADKVDGLSIEADVLDADGNKVLSLKKADENVSKGISEVLLKSEWKNPIPWMLDKGYLYTAKVSLKKDGKILDSQRIKFGFREVWTKGRTVYLNGKPARWRVEWTSFGITEKSLPLLKMLGRNTVYYQPNSTLWWSTWAEVPYYAPAEVELMDKAGIAVFMPVPGVSQIREALINDPKAERDYIRESREFMKRYRNHPCILAWSVGMNSFNPKDAIHPSTMGQRSDYKHSQARTINKALEIVKNIDHTRLGYCHADGNLGDIATSNCYPNFAPVQEYEDWPSIWAKKGNMPYFACEFAAFYNGSLYKGKQFLLTEYAAIYFGEKAFEKETRKQLEKTLEVGVKHRSHSDTLKDILPYSPIYWDLNRIFVQNTDRAWRTWGVNGWHYFNFQIGYGDPPEMTSKRPFGRYKCLKKKVEGVPSWVNPQFYTYSKNMQPLLVYIAGYPAHTDKDHAFYSGDTVKKQIAAIWDGPGKRNLKADWKLVGPDSKVLADGSYILNLDVGDIKFYPVTFKAPQVKRRTDTKLELNVTENGKSVGTYTFPIQIFPHTDGLKIKKRVVVFDPAEKSQWINGLGIKIVLYSKSLKLGDSDILVIGREALKSGSKLPYNLDDINRGLNVIVLEQKPEIWEGFGFKSIETSSRYVFATDKTSPLLSGLEAADLIHWRGSPNLLPEFKPARGYDVQHAPKVTNRNTVASCMLQIPQVTGFSPILVGEFALDYTSLLSFNTGKGAIVFSTLDLTDRVGDSPVPTRLAKNILKYADTFRPSNRKVVYTGSEVGRRMLQRLACCIAAKSAANPNDTVWLEYEKAFPVEEDKKFMADGGSIISINLPVKTLNQFGILTEKRKLYKVPVPQGSPLFSGITANLTRWRDSLDVAAITAIPGGSIAGDGLFGLERKGKGSRLFLQMTPDMLRNRYTGESDKRESMLLSVSTLNQLFVKILTNAGCAPAPELVKRMAELNTGNRYTNLGFWHVLGPFPVKGGKATAIMKEVFPGEKNSIAGDTNPNLNYKRKDGKLLDFRATAVSDGNGFIDIGKALNYYGTRGVAYATKSIDCKQGGEVMLRFGVDYFLKVWVNGKVVYEVTHGHGSPKANRHIFKVKMKKGENVITVKVLSGSKGFGFWANMSEPTEKADAADAAASEKETVNLYDPAVKLRDPYEYHYW